MCRNAKLHNLLVIRQVRPVARRVFVIELPADIFAPITYGHLYCYCIADLKLLGSTNLG